MFWRRLRSIPAFTVGFLLFLLLLPAIAPAVVVRDVVAGTRLGGTRFLGVVCCYGFMEVAGLLAAFAFWIARPVTSPQRYTALHQRLQTWWACTLLRILLFVYRVRLEVEGASCAQSGPYIMLMRHASMGDTLLPIRCVQAISPMRLRYVLKSELMWEPCLDVVGHRLPNVFVKRHGKQPQKERSKVAELARGLGELDGVVLFPEGTRFSPRRRERVIASLQAQGLVERAQAAQALTHVLPVRPGGFASMLRIHPDVDVVFGAHVGFEGATRLPDLLSGALLDRVVKVAFWRESTRGLKDDAQIREWLEAQWRRMDRWVSENQPSLDEGMGRRAGPSPVSGQGGRGTEGADLDR